MGCTPRYEICLIPISNVIYFDNLNLERLRDFFSLINFFVFLLKRKLHLEKKNREKERI